VSIVADRTTTVKAFGGNILYQQVTMKIVKVFRILQQVSLQNLVKSSASTLSANITSLRYLEHSLENRSLNYQINFSEDQG
jgi:hypothetical protein